ncbi:MAG: flagellar motor switch protein FliN [Candidatus Acidulodesulfobacterium acidiphilum]|uniref:Flagellar motor switch protein FliN n=1 Tax=Candidatus Acidulodesulfobacterium acidiphilum TaxID=2597224 RepID=A0A520XA08_9DELT|nr:MAG: flagellar motor switch protein FliN [Candidatus Acidulodesulfobacterium acidiphilum]
MSEENKTEELEKKAGEDAQVQSRAAGAETAKQAAPSEDEDDNISWEDAFKEEEAANAGAGANASSESTAPAEQSQAGGNSGTAVVSDAADLGVEDIKPAKNETAQPTPKKPVKKLEFASFDESDKTAEPPKNLDFILDIPLTISVELGRTKMVINDMLQLGQGSVIELAKLAGEPLDIYVNGKLMARGEVVLVNDKFGVRLTDIISPVERVKKL